MTEWLEFRAPDLSEIKKRLKRPNLFDARNLYSTTKVKEVGLNYFAIGKRV
jgi:UDPglucose 6-dehydrogenase